MGSKFKVGDRVRVVKEYLTAVPGDLGTIVDVSSVWPELHVRVDGKDAIKGSDEPFYFEEAEVELALVECDGGEAPEPTVKELVEQAIERVRRVQDGQRDEGAREMALAITHLEDGLMRFTRGMAMRLGVFSPADLEKIGDDPQAASAFLAERDQKASDAAQVQA